jgi:hypothetical protein
MLKVLLTLRSTFLQFLVVACLVQYRLPTLQKCRTSDRKDTALSEILSFVPEPHMTDFTLHVLGIVTKVDAFQYLTLSNARFY